MLDESIRLLREGQWDVVKSRTLTKTGITDIQVQMVLDQIQIIDNFASRKSDQFYQMATRQKNMLNHQLIFVITGILLLAAGISWFLLKNIKKPLQELTAAADQFRQGKMGGRSAYVSANEFGMLSAAFNTMADAIETHMQLGENAARLSGVMLREQELHAFCRELLKALMEHTGSQMGAVYFLNDTKTAFEHIESIGLGTRSHTAFSATSLEGEMGVVLATRQIHHITDIPADTRFAFAAVSGNFMPREILTIPVLSENEVVAVISLAGVHAYSDMAIRLVNEIWHVLTARMNGVLAFQKIQDLATRLQHQNSELEAQQHELGAQASELAAQSRELTQQNTELAMQARQLNEANRLKSAFLANMSHELRTPLNSVIALAGVLGRRLSGTIPEDESGYLEVIERNGRHLLSLINDILDLSRIESGREEISPVLFSLQAIVCEVVETIDPQAREKGITLANRVDDDMPSIISDPVKCRHILQNLIGNAVKFTDTGAVEIFARHGNDRIHVSISDTGIGIAENQIPHIFDEFRQVDDAASRKYGGTGLGLAIARKYALLLGGNITVESIPGQGTTFTLMLPLAFSGPESGDAEATPAADDSGIVADQPDSATKQGRSILLVEDNEPAVIQMTDILAPQGYGIQVARNGREAMTFIGESPPDAVILDLMMPEMDGFEVIRAMRENEQTAHIPVLILTAKHVTREELRFLKGNHIHQLIQKGDISRNALLAAVAGMVL